MPFACINAEELARHQCCSGPAGRVQVGAAILRVRCHVLGWFVYIYRKAFLFCLDFVRDDCTSARVVCVPGKRVRLSNRRRGRS